MAGHHDHRDVHANDPAAPNPPPAAAKTLRAWCNVRAAARCFSLVTKGGGAGGGDAGLRTVDFEVEMDGDGDGAARTDLDGVPNDTTSNGRSRSGRLT